MLALRSWLRKRGWFQERSIPEPNLAQQLDLVALGTVADVVALDKNNRIFSAARLASDSAKQCRPGNQALAAVAKRSLEHLETSDLAFALAPRLNAAGVWTICRLGSRVCSPRILQALTVLQNNWTLQQRTPPC